MQQEAIDCAMAGRNSVVVLPTGGGKSLCYQIPAICMEGVAVVVSPLISLMKDQVDSLVQNGIAAASINSSMTTADKADVAAKIRSGELKLLYLSPERLVQPSTLEFLKSSGVSFFAIDEAHCISSWGHDFRPEYRQLARLKEQFPDASVHAFTATATPRVRDDIVRQLNLGDAEMLVGSFDRPNLTYRVHRRHNVLGQVREIIDRYPKQSGVIYCISRKEVERVALTLSELGYSAAAYHAGMSDTDRASNQEAFINEQIDIIVATVAFGMGIDKSSVRFVIHTGMPKSLEAYQQESGRAGRDGLPAECALLFTGGDLMTWKRMMENGSGDPASAKASHDLLEAMYGYCTKPLCRHRMLVEYFGQSLPGDDCEACDVCLDEMETVEDSLIISQKIISCVHRVDQRFGTGHVAMVLTGSRSKKILDQGHDRVSTYRLLADHNKSQVGDWVEQLVAQGHLMKFGEYNVLKITDTGREVLRGEVTPKLVRSPGAEKWSRDGGKDDPWAGVDRDLFERLRELRKATATEKGVPPFVIFHDPALRDMARMRPSTLDQFATISGVGEAKLEQYGELFVNCIVSYCAASDVSLDADGSASQSAVATRTREKMLSPAREKAHALFAEGKSIAEVAESIDRAPSTTSGYLSEYIREHRITNPLPWVTADVVEKIQKACIESGSLERLAPVKELLPESIDYQEIRVVVECLKVDSGYHDS